jgi:GGDEF domain-containing protein
MRVITPLKNRQTDFERMAYYYGLTGHLNRPRLQGAFDEVLTDCHGVGAPAAYLLVNIDLLGMLNDTYGYGTADAGPLAVSLSLGGALLPKDAGTSREALSKAKQQGRDHFVLHRASPIVMPPGARPWPPAMRSCGP